MTKRIFLGCSVLILGLVACGSDDNGGGGGGGTANTDGGGATSGSGGSSGSATGGSGGTTTTTGGSGGTTTTTGGSGGTTTTGDSGVTTGGTGGTTSSGDAGGAPSDGSQLAACTMDSDCDPGLGCYTFGGYCSQTCSMDDDCASLTGATYTCFVGGGFPGGGADGGTGVCRIECMDANDTSCPQGMTCIDVGVGFRCAYSQGGGTGTTEAYGECQSSADCAMGLTCTAFGGGTGYCSEGCMGDGDCSAPATGTVAATCSGFQLCLLDCSADMSGCPDTMTCQMSMFGGGAQSFCNF